MLSEDITDLFDKYYDGEELLLKAEVRAILLTLVESLDTVSSSIPEQTSTDSQYSSIVLMAAKNKMIATQTLELIKYWLTPPDENSKD